MCPSPLNQQSQLVDHSSSPSEGNFMSLACTMPQLYPFITMANYILHKCSQQTKNRGQYPTLRTNYPILTRSVLNFASISRLLSIMFIPQLSSSLSLYVLTRIWSNIYKTLPKAPSMSTKVHRVSSFFRSTTSRRAMTAPFRRESSQAHRREIASFVPLFNFAGSPNILSIVLNRKSILQTLPHKEAYSLSSLVSK